MNKQSSQILLSPLFLLGLFLLLLNDFFLKYQFHNFLTGKISDFAGLFIFPVFFAAFFPKRKFAIYISTAILFVFWKSPFSQIVVDVWNSIVFFKIGRTIDFTDFLALLVLPLSYFYFQTVSQKQISFSPIFVNKVLTGSVIVFSIFTFTATTLVKDRSIGLESEFSFKLNEACAN